MTSQEEIRAVVRAVLDEERDRAERSYDDMVIRAVSTILTSFGMDEDDRKEIRADFIHLRKWRKSVEQAQGLTFKIVMTTIIGGLAGALWLGLKDILHK